MTIVNSAPRDFAEGIIELYPRRIILTLTTKCPFKPAIEAPLRPCGTIRHRIFPIREPEHISRIRVLDSSVRRYELGDVDRIIQIFRLDGLDVGWAGAEVGPLVNRPGR